MGEIKTVRSNQERVVYGPNVTPQKYAENLPK